MPCVRISTEQAITSKASCNFCNVDSEFRNTDWMGLLSRLTPLCLHAAGYCGPVQCVRSSELIFLKLQLLNLLNYVSVKPQTVLSSSEQGEN